MPPLSLGSVSSLKFIRVFLSAHRNHLCNFNSLEKKELGIGIGNALKKYKSLGRIVIFKIEALPNHKNYLGVHFCRSLVIEFNREVKLAE